MLINMNIENNVNIINLLDEDINCGKTLVEIAKKHPIISTVEPGEEDIEREENYKKAEENIDKIANNMEKLGEQKIKLNFKVQKALIKASKPQLIAQYIEERLDKEYNDIDGSLTSLGDELQKLTNTDNYLQSLNNDIDKAQEIAGEMTDNVVETISTKATETINNVVQSKKDQIENFKENTIENTDLIKYASMRGTLVDHNLSYSQASYTKILNEYKTNVENSAKEIADKKALDKIAKINKQISKQARNIIDKAEEIKRKAEVKKGIAIEKAKMELAKLFGTAAL